MKIVFFGSSEFSLPFLKYFSTQNEHVVVGVVTTPPKPKGRGRSVQSTCIDEYADEQGYRKFTPENLKDDSLIRELKALAPDMLLIASYGKYIPRAILELTPYPMNIHPSLLPRHRGPNPILEPILAGDVETGVTIMRTTAKMDAGDIALQKTIPLPAEVTGGALEGILIKEGLELLTVFLQQATADEVVFTVQDESKATATQKTNKEDTQFSWHDDVVEVDRKIRAYLPHPRAFFCFRGKKVFVEAGTLETVFEASRGKVDPVIAEVDKGGRSLLLVVPYGEYRLERVAPEGKRPMDAYDFIQGYRLKMGDSLV